MKATQRLYLDASGKKAVPSSDPKAATLWKRVGDEITEAEAKKYGLQSAQAKPEKTVEEPGDATGTVDNLENRMVTPTKKRGRPPGS